MANHALLKCGTNISTFSGLATNLNTILRLCQQRLVKGFSLLFAVGLGLSLMVAACSAPTSVAPNSTPTASQNRVVRIGATPGT
jgi:hypothetical protein